MTYNGKNNSKFWTRIRFLSQLCTAATKEKRRVNWKPEPFLNADMYIDSYNLSSSDFDPERPTFQTFQFQISYILNTPFSKHHTSWQKHHIEWINWRRASVFNLIIASLKVMQAKKFQIKNNSRENAFSWSTKYIPKNK